MDFDPGPGIANLDSSSGRVFFARYDASGAYVYAYNIDANWVNTIVSDDIGNIYITGYSWYPVDFDPGPGVALDSAGSFFAKYDASGAYVYAHSIGTMGVSSIVNDDMGNIYITGVFFGTVDFDPGPGVANMIGDYDCFIARYDTAGNYVYAKAIASTNPPVKYSLSVRAIALDANSNIFITGTLYETVDFDPGPGISNLAGNTDHDNIFVASYNANGNYLYAKAIEGTNRAYGDDFVKSIAVDGSGNAYITGYFEGSPDFDPGAGTATLTTDGKNAFVLKLSVDGNYVWANQLGRYSPGQELSDFGNGIVVDASGNSFITGSFSGTVDFDPGPGTAYVTSKGSSDIFIAKFDASGNFLFAKGIGSIKDDDSKGIAFDGSGNVYITGYFNDTADFDPGQGVVNLATGSRDFFFAKYDPFGNYIYAKNIAGANDPMGPALAVTSTGKVYLTGSFYGTVDFDPGAGVANLTSARSCFIAKYDVSGNYVYAKEIGSTAYITPRGIGVDGSGNAFITGTLSGTADFDPGPGVVNITSSYPYDVFLAKYDPTGSYVYAKSIPYSRAFGIAVDNSGNTFITGSFDGTADFDPGPGVANMDGDDDCFIARYDASGNYVYAKSLRGSNDDLGFAIAVDGSGNAYAVGRQDGLGFVAMYDAGSNNVYVKKFEGSGSAIAVDITRNVYVTGVFGGIANFDKDGGSANGILTAYNGGDIFIVKYGPAVQVTYTFIGNGNWDIPSNWLDNNMPPDTITSGQHIIINPALNGACILNKPLTVRLGGKLTVEANAKFEIKQN
jgi:hypothetical protein